MKFKLFFASLFILVIVLGCKKSQLQGDYAYLTGTWKWTASWEDGMNDNYELTFKEKGKYQLHNKKKLVDYGRIIIEKKYPTFHSNRLYEKSSYLDKRSVSVHSGDKILIQELNLFDVPVSQFTKK